MATKSPKKQQPQTSGDRIIATGLRPRDNETQYTGDEPLFAEQPDSDRRTGALVRAFNWYSRYYDRKMAKEQFILYATENGRLEDAKALARVDEREVMATLGWLARLSMRGLELTSAETTTIESEIARLIQTLAKPQKIVKAESEPETKSRANIQEVMLERARSAAGEFEGLLDDAIMSEIKSPPEGRVISELTEKNILPQHIKLLVEVWTKKAREFELAHSGKDSQLTEGYKNFTKTQLKNLVKFCEAVINDLNGYTSVKRAVKKARTRKAVPVEKIVSKLKYLKRFEDATHKIKLESISPTKLHGCSEAWVYNTANRKLIHLVADDYSKTLTVKGNAVLGFDKAKSECKTIRKPSMLTEFMKVGKPAKRTQFKELTTTPTEPNGRFNENMVILLAF